MHDKLSELESKINFRFKNKDHLIMALTHRSYLNENPKWGQDHNERLEFLGDAVLELVVTEYLYKTYPNPEGELTNWRASLVNAVTLSRITGEFDLNDYVLLSKGEAKDTGRARQYILANAMESLIGAIYLDGGLSAAFNAVKKHFSALFDEASTLSAKHDTKTQLQEITQAKFRKSPTYKVVSEEGPDHEKLFEVMVSVGALKRYGKGRNKKEAEQDAARFLLDYLLNQPTETKESRA